LLLTVTRSVLRHPQNLHLLTLRLQNHLHLIRHPLIRRQDFPQMIRLRMVR
jgi:hypothetical protein